jgi:hypothetical protein
MATINKNMDMDAILFTLETRGLSVYQEKTSDFLNHMKFYVNDSNTGHKIFNGVIKMRLIPGDVENFILELPVNRKESKEVITNVATLKTHWESYLWGFSKVLGLNEGDFFVKMKVEKKPTVNVSEEFDSLYALVKDGAEYRRLVSQTARIDFTTMYSLLDTEKEVKGESEGSLMVELQDKVYKFFKDRVEDLKGNLITINRDIISRFQDRLKRRYETRDFAGVLG